MSVAKLRAGVIADTLDRVRMIIGKKGVTRAGLDEIRGVADGLARRQSPVSPATSKPMNSSFSRGTLVLPDGAGLGVALSDAKLRNFKIKGETTGEADARAA